MTRTKHNGFYFIIYKTTNLVNGKIYVGQHGTKKLNDGYIGDDIYNQRRIFGNSLFCNAVRKYGYKNFKREIVKFCSTREQLDVQEVFWIKELKSHMSLGGYNMTWGGGGGDTITNHPNREEILKNFKKSKEFKQKLRIWHTGRKDSPETKRKKGEKSKGRTHTMTESGKQSLREFNTGRKDSPETCKKKSDGHKNKIPWNKGLTKETDERVRAQGKKGKVPWNKGLVIKKVA